MTRTRLSTTVDRELLETARALRSGTTDAVLVDEALKALLSRHRSAEVDASYAAYDEHPIDEFDEWGNLGTFRQAAAAS
jgi:antitoxin MazE5